MLQSQTSDRQAKNRQCQSDQYLRTLHLRNRFLTVTPAAANALGHRGSQQTVARRIRAYGIGACRLHRGHLLIVRNLHDKRMFTVGGSSVFTTEGKTACCVQEVVPFGGGSVVWGGICGQERISLRETRPALHR